MTDTRTFKTYEEVAKYQNMEVARAKAIQIMEYLGVGRVLKNEAWYEAEDELVNIIKSK